MVNRFYTQKQILIMLLLKGDEKTYSDLEESIVSRGFARSTRSNISISITKLIDLGLVTKRKEYLLNIDKNGKESYTPRRLCTLTESGKSALDQIKESLRGL